MSSRELRIRYTGDARGVFGALKQIEQAHVSMGDKLRAVGQRISSAGKSLTKGLTLPIVGFGIAAVHAFGESQKVMAQTQAVLESTGGAAGVTEKQIAKLATGIQNYSGMSDEAIQSTENLLLTFTNIRNVAGKNNDIFTQSTKIAADMSIALGQDMKSSAIQLGKALNDPIKGVTALQRVGVSFTDAQKKQIEAMVKSGNVMGAQKLVLAELTKEFGGSAKAIGETAAGQWNIAKEKIGNAMETIGQTIVTIGLPIFERLASGLKAVLDWFNNLSEGTKHWVVVIGAMVAAVGPVLIVVGKLVSAFGIVAKAFTALSALLSANPYILLIAATVAIVALIIANWDKIKVFLSAVWEAIVAAGKFFWDHLAVFILGPMKFVIDWLIDHWRGFKTVFIGIWNLIADVLGPIIRGIVATIRTIVGVVEDVIDAVKTAIGWLEKLNPFRGFSAPGPTQQVGGRHPPTWLQHGGIVRRPTLALLGEAGPEAVVPLGGRGVMGAGVMVVNVYNEGTLIGTSPQDLARLIRDELVDFQRRNGNSTGIRT